MFICSYCDEKIDLLSKFDRHNCKQKTRTELVGTPVGFAAYKLYNKWLNTRGLTNKDVEIFVDSKYFNAFIRFVEYNKKTTLPDVNMFLKYCIDNTHEPYVWRSYEIYEKFIEYYFKNVTVEDSCKLTVDTFAKLASTYSIEVKDIYTQILPSVLLKQVAAHIVTPWMLFLSRKFQKYYAEKCNAEHKQLFNSVMPAKAWKLKIDGNSAGKTKALEFIKYYEL